MAKRKIEIQVVGDSKSLEHALGRAGKSASSLEKRFGSLARKGAIALGGLGIAGAGVGAKLVKMAGDAAEVESKFKVVFGREMPKMTKQLDKFSEATGASRYQLRQQTADMGALLSPILGNVQAAGKMSVGFTKLATDLSSFNNIPVADALEKIRAGLVGEAEPLRSVGVLLTEATVKEEAYRAGIAKRGAALTEGQKVQARANLIMQQTTLAQGDAERTAGSFTNQLRRLQNQVRDTATDLGAKMLPTVTRVLTKLNEWGPAIAEKVQPQLDKLGKWADAHKTQFKDLFTEIKQDAEKAGTAVLGIGKGADKTAMAMGGWDQAFTMVLSGLLASKLAKVLAPLAGRGGIAATLLKIKSLGPTIAIAVVIDLAINEEHRKKLAGWADLLAKKVGLGDPRWIPLLGIFAKGPGGNSGASLQPPAGTGGQATVPGGASSVFPIPAGTSFTRGGGVAAHGSRALGNWQSDNAVDIMVEPGTPILSVVDGVVSKVSGQTGFGSRATVFGFSVTIDGAGNRYFYTHLGAVYVKQGQKVKRGQVIGRAAAGTPGGPHLHFASEKGSPESIFLASRADLPSGSSKGGGGSSGVAAGGGGAVTPSPVAVAVEKVAKTKKVDITTAIDFAQLKEKMTSRFQTALDAARAKVTASKEAFGNAFDRIADKILMAFDKKTEQLLANARAKVAAFGFDIGVGEETPTEKLLRERLEARETAALQNALASATTEEERQAALTAIEDRALEKRAAAERAAADKALDDERQRLQDQRELQRAGFTDELAALEKKWATTKATTKTRTDELKTLMAKYDIPFGEVGTLIGQSFAAGFMASLQEVFATLNELEKRLRKVKQTEDLGPMLTSAIKGAGTGTAVIRLIPGFADGVKNFAGGMALVGERGPEMVSLPRGSSVTPIGGAVIENHTHVYLDSKQIFTAVQREAIQNVRNGGRGVPGS